MILSSSHRSEDLGVELDADRPVRRYGEDVSALEGADARRFRETQLVTNDYSDAEAAELVDGRRVVAGRGEAVDPQEWEVRLGVFEAPSV